MNSEPHRRRMPLISGEPNLWYVCHACKATLPTVATGHATTCGCGNIELDWRTREVVAIDMAQVGLRQT